MLAQSGIDFVHFSGDSAEKPFPAANGSGVAAFDYDLDGSVDLLFLTGIPFPIDPAQTRISNRAYRNRGSWKFEDVTAATNLGHTGYSAGVAVGDFDSDGFPDVYVNCFGPNRLYRNQGDGTFIEMAQPAGVDDDRWGTSAAFLDYDNDGLLDLYVCNYGIWSWETNQFCGDRGKNIRIFCNPSTIEAVRHVLYHNDGDGRFHDALEEAGINVTPGRGQGVVAADVNGDGLIDLYVGNDLHPNFLFLNSADGKFSDASELSGAAHDHLGRNQAGMGVDAADANGDGRFELFVTNYEGEHNAYYENLGNAMFQDLSHARGLAADSIPYIGWGTQFADFDLDGWPDIVVTNGHTDNNLKQLGRDSEYEQPPGLWHNDTGRFTFCGGSAAGDYFAARHVGRGLAVADLDNDGDPDVIVAHKDAPPALLRNDAFPFDARTASPQGESNPSWIHLQLVGVRSNRDAIGAAVTLRTDKKNIVRQIKGGGSYLSSGDQRLGFPLHTANFSLEIRWPSGLVTRPVSIATDRTSLIRELHHPE